MVDTQFYFAWVPQTLLPEAEGNIERSRTARQVLSCCCSAVIQAEDSCLGSNSLFLTPLLVGDPSNTLALG